MHSNRGGVRDLLFAVSGGHPSPFAEGVPWLVEATAKKVERRGVRVAFAPPRVDEEMKNCLDEYLRISEENLSPHRIRRILDLFVNGCDFGLSRTDVNWHAPNVSPTARHRSEVKPVVSVSASLDNPQGQ